MKYLGWIIMITIYAGIFAGATAWSIKLGNPNAVWFYCDILHWCKS